MINQTPFGVIFFPQLRDIHTDFTDYCFPMNIFVGEPPLYFAGK